MTIPARKLPDPHSGETLCENWTLPHVEQDGTCGCLIGCNAPGAGEEHRLVDQVMSLVRLVSSDRKQDMASVPAKGPKLCSGSDLNSVTGTRNARASWFPRVKRSAERSEEKTPAAGARAYALDRNND